ncbi:MAG: DUF4238 domain-containing protein [Verrucomicrobia bacterium]|nr:DUF4238 domain-containing protein [Verrucomicrobiota bacterium]
MAKDHFVPRHYLRQFTINKSENIVVANISPYRFMGVKGIGGQCQETDFYENDEALEKVLWTAENDLAPVLKRVSDKADFTEPELVALKSLAAHLHFRTKKTAEAYKFFQKRIFYEVIKNAIDVGQLPPPPEGKWTEEMVDCKGVSGFLIKDVISCSMEMQTLASKLIKAEDGASFVTSDNPVIILNQFCANAEPHHGFAGFNKSGFQLLLPISPKLCLLVYDAKIYKVGSPRRRLVEISNADVEIVNALQIQSAENFIYFHETKLEQEVQSLIERFRSSRIPVEDLFRLAQANNKNEELMHFRTSTVKLPKIWSCCSLRRHIKFLPGDRRNPAWSALVEELEADFRQNLTDEDIFSRLQRIIADPHSLKNIQVR